MNHPKILMFLFAFMILSCCDNSDVGECSGEACFDLSDLISKTNHELPFKLYNDLKIDFEKIILNGKSIELEYGETREFAKAGFYELVLFEKHSSQTILFTLGTPEREHAEWGTEAWVPAAFVPGNSGFDEIKSIYPRRFYPGMSVPFVFYALKNGSPAEGYSIANSGTVGESFNIKHGVGSFMLEADNMEGTHEFMIGDQSLHLGISVITGSPANLSGELTDDLIINENSAIRITGDLSIPANTSLTIHAGALILIDEGVNISNDGPVSILGTEENPVLITCSEKGKYWGGFISNGLSAEIDASYAIFCQSGYHDSGIYANWGHAKRQALFYTENSVLTLSHCYMMDHIGQIFYPLNSSLNLQSILIQRVKTSGQLNYSTVEITNSIFTDFPNDNYEYADNDNDGLYISSSDVSIDDCIFMFAKDDGIDSGGNEGGTVTITNTRFEACFHEGAALSSSNEVVKMHSFENCIFYNCGQGLELGFSSPNHTVSANNCQFLNNGIGIRYGDNYDWSSVNGQMFINNSQSLGNTRDVWNMVRQIWAPRLNNMHFNNVQVSSPVSQYPNLEVIN